MIEARIAKRFAAAKDSAAFSLEAEFRAGEGVTVLYGASGAGKTLTLESIAGFATPDAGRILLEDRLLFDAESGVNLRPQARHCGYVFQNHALFPHMTLRENLAFAAERLPRLERHRKVTAMLERFRLAEIAGRYPREVSGGQKQRCSIGRALIGNPRALLLDEPARGLDSDLRQDLYDLLRELRREHHIPMLLVTHDLAECFALADTLLIFSGGRIVQSGDARRVFEQPASPEVARLLGIANLFEAEVLALDPARDTSRVRAFGAELTARYLPGRLLGDRVWLCASAEELRIADRPGENRIPAKLTRIIERPENIRLEFDPKITVDLSRGDYAHNTTWFIEFPPLALRSAG